MKAAVVDTDILSALMRGDPRVVLMARTYLPEHRRLAFSVITRYEILRGLMAKEAVKQIESFHLFCSKGEILGISDTIIVKAASIYAELRRRGELIGDADILVAATAIVAGRAVVTNNVEHFRRIRELDVVNWLA